MSNLLVYKDRYRNDFANCMMDKYRMANYGIACNKAPLDCDLSYIRNEILEWEEHEDSGALTQVSVAYMSWLHVTLNDNPASYYGGFTHPGCAMPCTQTCETDTLGFSYENGNIVDINVGGCMTRININPNVTINGGSYQYHIVTPAATWTIYHNLGFAPNVLTTDASGNEISGVVSHINMSTVQIDFSQPVAGYAYLS